MILNKNKIMPESQKIIERFNIFNIFYNSKTSPYKFSDDFRNKFIKIMSNWHYIFCKDKNKYKNTIININNQAFEELKKIEDTDTLDENELLYFIFSNIYNSFCRHKDLGIIEIKKELKKIFILSIKQKNIIFVLDFDDENKKVFISEPNTETRKLLEFLNDCYFFISINKIKDLYGRVTKFR